MYLHMCGGLIIHMLPCCSFRRLPQSRRRSRWRLRGRGPWLGSVAEAVWQPLRRSTEYGEYYGEYMRSNSSCCCPALPCPAPAGRLVLLELSASLATYPIASQPASQASQLLLPTPYGVHTYIHTHTQLACAPSAGFGPVGRRPPAAPGRARIMLQSLSCVTGDSTLARVWLAGRRGQAMCSCHYYYRARCSPPGVPGHHSDLQRARSTHPRRQKEKGIQGPLGARLA